MRVLLQAFAVTVLPAAIVLVATPSWPHDVRGLNHNSIKLSNQLNHARLQQLAERAVDDRTRYVISRLLLWLHGQKLRACFLKGDEEERNLVVTGANELLAASNANVSFDFGSPPKYRDCDNARPRYDVRVSFTHPCCAAYVGTQAHDPDAQDEPSVVLGGISQSGPEKRLQIVKHELLHVLGFEHEHQSPDAICATEFFKDRVKAAYDWDEQTYQTNMAQLNKDSRSYIWSSYDPKSIMKYYFSPTLLEKGRDSKCYTGENYQLSERDVEGLRLAFPMAAPPLSNTQTRDALMTISGSQMPQAATDLARELGKLRR